MLPEKLPPSKLGTKSYWDEFYATEIDNFKQDDQDTGECWFSESGAEEKVSEYVGDLQPATILDLGTGNGHLLFSLRDEGVQSTMLGIDYSHTSIELATSVAAAQGYEDVKFQQVDFLQSPDWTAQKWDLVLDKGTLDAIALSNLSYDGEPAEKRYIEAIKNLVAPGGTFLITSCNFTQQELADMIGQPYTCMDYPTFSFGGAKGSTVVSLVFSF